MSEITIKRMKRGQLVELIEKTIQGINKIHSVQESILKLLGEAQSSRDLIEDKGGLKDQIVELVADAKIQQEEIQKAYDEICVDTDQADSIKTELEELVESFKEISKLAGKFEDKYFGVKKVDEKTGETIKEPGLLEEIESYLQGQKEKFNQLSDKINTELLPGATTVGLAKAYVDQSGKYKSGWWITLFGISILAMLVVAFWSFIAFEAEEDLGKELIALLTKMTFFIPLVWIALFASRKDSQNKRLQQEYIHKGTMAKSFEGYRAQVEKLDESDKSRQIKEQLMEELVKMVGYNPSITLDSKSHKDSPPGLSAIEKVAESISKCAGGIAAEVIKQTR